MSRRERVLVAKLVFQPNRPEDKPHGRPDQGGGDCVQYAENEAPHSDTLGDGRGKTRRPGPDSLSVSHGRPGGVSPRARDFCRQDSVLFFSLALTDFTC